MIRYQKALALMNGVQITSWQALKAEILSTTKAITKWMRTTPIGWVALASIVISALAGIYDAFTDSAKEIDERVDTLIKKYDEAKNKADENAKNAKELTEEYERLSKGVNNLGENISLTSDEYSKYNQIVNQIADMFPDLVSGYTQEGNAILSLRGNVEKLRDAYKEAQQEAYNLLITKGEDSDGEDIVKAYKKLSKVDFFDSGNIIGSDDFSTVAKRDITKQIIDLMKDLESAPEKYSQILEDVHNKYDVAGVSFLEDMGLPTVIKPTKESLKLAKTTVQAYYQTYQSEINSKLKNFDSVANAFLLTNEDYSKLDEQARTVASLLVNNLTEDIVNEFSSLEDVGAYVANIISQLKDNPVIGEAMVGLFTTDLSDMSVDNAKAVVNQYVDIIANALNEDPVKLKVRLGFDDYSDENINPLITKVQGFLEDEFDVKVGELSLDDLQIASKLEVLGKNLLSWDELLQEIKEAKEQGANADYILDYTNSLGEAVKITKEQFATWAGFSDDNPFDGAIDSTKEYIQVLKKLDSVTSTASNALAEYNKNGEISADTAQSLMEIDAGYADVLEIQNGKITVNIQSFKDRTKAMYENAIAAAQASMQATLDGIDPQIHFWAEYARESLRKQGLSEGQIENSDAVKAKQNEWLAAGGNKVLEQQKFIASLKKKMELVDTPSFGKDSSSKKIRKVYHVQDTPIIENIRYFFI